MKIVSNLWNRYKLFRLHDELLLNDSVFKTLYMECRPYTMTSLERLYSLYSAVSYVIKNDIEGDFVECGVWRGGSSMMIAGVLKSLGVKDRTLYLYDTFEGMPPPSSDDTRNITNKKPNKFELDCACSLDEVKNNMKLTGYPENNIKYIKGKVEETIPNTIPSKISLLRLDTDWYESTKHELENLFPVLSESGVLILDDYGYWNGAKKAVDDYMRTNHTKILLNRIDNSGRIGIKC